jgi:hypothetical protein
MYIYFRRRIIHNNINKITTITSNRCVSARRALRLPLDDRSRNRFRRFGTARFVSTRQQTPSIDGGQMMLHNHHHHHTNSMLLKIMIRFVKYKSVSVDYLGINHYYYY